MRSASIGSHSHTHCLRSTAEEDAAVATAELVAVAAELAAVVVLAIAPSVDNEDGTCPPVAVVLEVLSRRTTPPSPLATLTTNPSKGAVGVAPSETVRVELASSRITALFVRIAVIVWPAAVATRIEA